MTPPPGSGVASVQQEAVEGAFIDELERFLEEARDRFGGAAGSGGGRTGLFPELTPEDEVEELRAARAWRAHRFDAGFGWITGPVRYGGRGLSAAHERLYLRHERRSAFPPQRIFDIGIGMVAPTLETFGTEPARRRYLRSLRRGDIVGCQLFSEPDAGSDLASISTVAVEEAGEWRVSGQKIWSSGAHLSDVGLLVCRTGAPAERHRNLTAFLLPMDSEGVTVRPIRQMTGGSSFNEVFMEDVRIPDELRLGDRERGWNVVVATLMRERAAVGGPAAGGGGVLRTARLAELLRRSGRLSDPYVRDELMRLHCSLMASRMTRQRAEASAGAGQPPGPEMSVGKLMLTNNLAAVSRIVALALGPHLVANSGVPETYAWAEFVLGVPGLRIGGGTDEVQRNILAERVLGLPR